MSRSELYLDHAATTPLDPEVLEAMLPYLREQFGNPSSVHRAGQRARRAVERAREQVAEAVGADPRQVTFTSGATEADDQAVFGAVLVRPGGLVVSATEHAAVRSAAARMRARGVDVVEVRPAPDGSIDVAALREAIEAQSGRGGTALVAAMLVNNETGVITDVRSVSRLAHEVGALVLCDAVQGFGTEEVTLAATDADLLTISAHKVYGPKGAGALVARPGLELPPLLAGGAQERGLRPGTHAVPSIVGFGVAAELAMRRRPTDRATIRAVRDRFERRATTVEGVRVNGGGAPRGVKHVNLRVDGVDGETLLMLLDEAGVMASAGSACAAGSVEPSHVLLAMGLEPAQAKASVRFSFGRGLTDTDADDAAARFAEAVARARAAAPATAP